MELLETATIITAYLAPLYITNACALLFGGKTPLDFDVKIDGKPLFGKGKSIEGTLYGFAAGILAVLAIDAFFNSFTRSFVPDFVFFGALLCAGALAGDIAASFIKRRFGIERGKPVLFLDQLDFVCGGLAFTAWIRIPAIEEVLIMMVITLLAHRISNYAAFKFKLKSVPW
ncbi:MAG: CDP-2,3-bis-(O-geranylgeranyl)-sn-glycerol synthase [Candidatus Diapherotrites archaeon]